MNTFFINSGPGLVTVVTNTSVVPTKSDGDIFFVYNY